MSQQVIIIGGGLAGLTASYSLHKQGLKPLLLEAGDRLGGRIYTKYQGGSEFELGATWVFADPNLRKLLNELGLTLEPQYLSGDALLSWHPSSPTERTPTETVMQGQVYHKVKGGTSAIVDRLSKRLDASHIQLNHKVETISFHENNATITLVNGKTLLTNHVILAVPPSTIAQRIQITPTPSLDFKKLMTETHTWMGDSLKFTAAFDKDYWKAKGLSGFGFSNYGLIREMQDHSNSNTGRFALVGFLNPNRGATLNFGERERMAKEELSTFFDIEPVSIIGYEDFHWSEQYTTNQGNNYNDGLAPHQNNGDDWYQQPHFNGKLLFAGAETSPVSPGYMEGAVISAYRVTQSLLKVMT